MHLLTPSAILITINLLSHTTALALPDRLNAIASAAKPDLTVCTHQNNPPQTRMLVVSLTSTHGPGTDSSLTIQILDDKCNEIYTRLPDLDPAPDFSATLSTPKMAHEMVIKGVTMPTEGDMGGWYVAAKYAGLDRTASKDAFEGCVFRNGDGKGDLADVTLGCTFFDDSGFPGNKS